jgi:hypothetical protein
MPKPDSKKAGEVQHLGFTFHRTFSLIRSAVSQVLRAAQQAEGNGLAKLDGKGITDLTSLGSIYIEAMPRYGKGSGLLNDKNFLTGFGKIVVSNDLHMDQVSTQWLVHYHMSAPHGPGPIFWNQVISKFFYPGNLFSGEDVADFIGNFYFDAKNKVLSTKAVKSSATIFLGTYTKPEGLGKLKLLEITDSGRYRVQSPVIPTAWVIGYALLDFWKAQYPDRIGVSLDVLMNSGFPQLFLMAKSDLDEVLRIMQENQYVDVHRTAPPFQVMLLRQDQESILEKIYGSN